MLEKWALRKNMKEERKGVFHNMCRKGEETDRK